MLTKWSERLRAFYTYTNTIHPLWSSPRCFEFIKQTTLEDTLEFKYCLCFYIWFFVHNTSAQNTMTNLRTRRILPPWININFRLFFLFFFSLFSFSLRGANEKCYILSIIFEQHFCLSRSTSLAFFVVLLLARLRSLHQLSMQNQQMHSIHTTHTEGEKESSQHDIFL